MILPGTGRGTARASAWWRWLVAQASVSPAPLHQPAAGPPPRPGEEWL
jgi:UDP-N-acetylmuramoylalanine--D-glutamate ligase